MKKIILPLFTALALVGISSTTIRADDTTYSRGFLYNISTGDLTDVVYNYTETELNGISGSFVIGNSSKDWSNPLCTNNGFLTNVITHESRVINVPGSKGGVYFSAGGSYLTAIGGNTVAGFYFSRSTKRNFLYKINDRTYTTNITFTNSYPWATNNSIEYTSDTYAVALNWRESNSYTTNYDSYNNSYTINTNSGHSDIIVYNISNGTCKVIIPTNTIYTDLDYRPVGISSNIVVGNFWGKKNSTNWIESSTNGSFFYNASTAQYTELPLINGNTPNATAISGDVILGYWGMEYRQVSDNSWIREDYLFTYSTSSNSYIQTNISPVMDSGMYPSSVEFEENLAVGYIINQRNGSDAYLYDMSQPIDNTNNPIVFGMPGSLHNFARGISGDYVIGNYYSTTPIPKPAPTLGTFTIPAKVYGNPPFLLTAPKSQSKGKFSYSSDNSAVATVIGNKVTIRGTGSASITATQAASGNYGGATRTVVLTVSKAVQKITFSLPASVVFKSNGLIRLRGTDSAKLPITYTSSDNSILSISGSTATMIARGRVTITASQSGNSNYREAPSVVRTITLK
jgi:hypothetical protein